MDLSEPITIIMAPRYRETAEAVAYAVEVLSPDVPDRHLIAPLLSVAGAQLESLTPAEALASREFVSVGRWGQALKRVSNWDGFEELLLRVKQERKRFEDHLFEAHVGALLSQIADCGGRFFPQSANRIPDIELSLDPPVVVECKLSEAANRELRSDYERWAPIADAIRRDLEANVPAAVMRIRMDRGARSWDHSLLTRHTAKLLREIGSGAARAGHPFVAPRSSPVNAEVWCYFVALEDPDAAFDAIAPEGYVEVPAVGRPHALRLQIERGDQPTCEGLWWIEIQRSSDWRSIEKAVLDRIDDKAKQLRDARRAGATGERAMGLIWIEHPPLLSAKPEQIRHLCDRVAGKLRKNDGGLFDAAAGVILSQSRLVMNKQGVTAEQVWLRPIVSDEGAASDLPFLGAGWWETAMTRLKRFDGDFATFRGFDSEGPQTAGSATSKLSGSS